MSLGFRQAGFEVVQGFDIDARHVEVYRANFGSSHGAVADLGRIAGEELLTIAGVDKVDILFGGPPCQGFSYGGRRDPLDPRNLLLPHFARLICEIRPKIFVVENVSGLLSPLGHKSLHRFLSLLEKGGYRVRLPLQILNASLFGVPQRRHRTFILGARRDMRLPRYPAPVERPAPTVLDAIGDLPNVDRYKYLLDSDVYRGTLGAPSHYAARLRKRGVNSGLTGCQRTIHSNATIVRFRSTPPGGVEPISRYYRLDPHGTARTIRAGTGPENGKHTAPRPIHYRYARCITVREAARLHGFPDSFQFHQTKWHAFRQIGNSVPVPLARSVASAVFQTLS